MYDIRHPHTKKRYRVKGFSTKGEADQARSIILEQWRNEKFGTNTSRASSGIRLVLRDELEYEAKLLREEAVDFFTQSHLKIAQTIDRFAKSVEPTVKITEMRAAHLDNFIKSELSRGLKAKTVETYLVHIKITLKRVQARSGSLLAGWEMPKTIVPGAKNKDGRLRRIWNEEEISKVLYVLSHPEEYHKKIRRNRSGEAAWKDTHDVLSIAALTGARKTEILLLEWGKVYFEWDLLHMRTLKQRREGETYREIPMSSELKELLLARREVIRKRYGVREQGVFPRWKDEGNADWIYRALKQACQVAGVEYGQGELGIVPHGLRHTAATRMLHDGTDIITAAEILGHSPKTMLETYAHATMASKKKAVSGLSIKPLRLVPQSSEKAA
jgi:integrase